MDWNELKSVCAGRVQFGVSAAPATSYHLGGPVAAWVEPRDVKELADLMAFLHRHGAKFLPLGGGSNVLFADEGFDGAVVRLGRPFQGVEVEGEFLRVKAGTPLPAVVHHAMEAGLGGFEYFAGIPGQVGGAVAGDAGSGKDWIGTRVESLTWVTAEGEIQNVSGKDVAFSYRHSSLQDMGCILVEVVFRGERRSAFEIEDAIADYLKKRHAKQPYTDRSAGSVFRNPEGEVAGRLIEEVGLKGYRVGGARVSEVHANFIVSDGGKALDVAWVMREAQRKVWEAKGIRLVPEILPAGDWDWAAVSDIWWHREGPYGFKAEIKNS